MLLQMLKNAYPCLNKAVRLPLCCIEQAGKVSEEERKSNSRARPVHLTLVSFAVTRKAYEVITERFAEEYERATGVPVRFRLSFGGSGTQVRPEQSPAGFVSIRCSQSRLLSTISCLLTCTYYVFGCKLLQCGEC